MVASFLPAFVYGQSVYPSRPIRMVIPFAAGGAIDMMARPVGKKLQELLGQPVVIDNRGGAGGNIGAELVAKSSPDGYSLLMGSTSPLAINPAYFSRMSYDVLRDFTPIAQIVQQPLIIVTNLSQPFRNIQDVVAFAKRNPGKLNYGSAGLGTSNHLVGEMLSNSAGIKMEQVPFQGGAPALVALLGGQIELLITQPNTVLTHVKSGRVRALATTGAKRSPAYPDVGTLVEAGYKDLDVVGWYCIVGPANMPRPIVDRLNADIRRAIASPEVHDALIAEGTEPTTGSPEELGTLMKTELERWAKVVKRAGIKSD